MKFPEDVRRQLLRRFRNKHREWLAENSSQDRSGEDAWPLEVNLDVPTENQAIKQIDDVRAWVAAWQIWRIFVKWSKHGMNWIK